MPRTVETKEWRSVSFPELVTKLGGGSGFSVDSLVGMIASAENKGEDFRIVCDEGQFVVPLALITEYFQDHRRPAVKMSQKEELEYLRKKVAELEDEREKADGTEFKPNPVIPMRGQESHSLPPPRDSEIPSPDRMSPEQIREDLKKDLRGKPILTKESPTVKKARAEAGL